ncbi:MAG: ATP synthase F1 subunit delta [Bacteroidetes bacterium]|nr:MAG: ATP synthase F1 subunit delta [Bacteroidota bacterium]
MSESRVASRYAKSLIELAVEKNCLEEVHQDMLLVRNTCESSRDLRMMLSNPIISSDRKLKSLKAIFAAKLSKLSEMFLDIISRKNRNLVLYEIAQETHNQYNVLKKIQVAQVITPFPLDESLRNSFLEVIKEITGSVSVELSEKVDDTLIGGFVLNINDRQIDSSIKNRLAELRGIFAN